MLLINKGQEGVSGQGWQKCGDPLPFRGYTDSPFPDGGVDPRFTVLPSQDGTGWLSINDGGSLSFAPKVTASEVFQMTKGRLGNFLLADRAVPMVFQVIPGLT